MEVRKVGLCQRQSVSNWYKSTLFLKEEMVATRPILRMCDIAVVQRDYLKQGMIIIHLLEHLHRLKLHLL